MLFDHCYICIEALLLISLNKKIKYCAWTNCKTDCGCLFAKLIRLTSWLYSISHWHLQLLVLNVSTVIPFSTLMVHRYASRDFLLTLSHYTHSIPLYSHYPIILELIPLYSQYPIILTVSHYTISACLFFELRICVLIQRVSENLENGIYIGTSQTLLYFTKLLFHKLWLHWKLRCIHWLKSTCITTVYYNLENYPTKKLSQLLLKIMPRRPAVRRSARR